MYLSDSVSKACNTSAWFFLGSIVPTKRMYFFCRIELMILSSIFISDFMKSEPKPTVLVGISLFIFLVAFTDKKSFCAD